MADRWTERLGDFVIGIASPTRAMIRKHWRRIERDDDYRTAYELACRIRGYKAAGHGKNQTAWLNASNRSADGEILRDLPTLRSRSRALNRDDALASGITGTLVRGVVGTGLRPQATTGDDVKDDALEAVWAMRADRLARGEGDMAHGGHQRLIYGKRIEDGEIILRPAVAMPGEPLWIESVEAERLATPQDAQPVDPAGRIVDGVEKDGHGRVIAYWLLQKHPFDFVTSQTKAGPKDRPVSTFSKQYFDRVDAATVRHDRAKVTRPGQSRGVPFCHAIMQDLRDLDLLILASLKKTQIAACLAVLLKTESASSDLIELTAQDYGYQLDQKLEPGMIFRLYPGEDATIVTPTAGAPELDKFVMLLARRIGAAIGLSPQAILRAWEGVNYSGARTIKIDDRQTYRGERADFAATLTWEWKVVLEDELLRGNPDLLAASVTVDDLEHVTWIGDEEQWVDPLAEAQAVEVMLRLGLTTYQIECARLGHDWQKNLRDKLAAEKFERDERSRLGLPNPALAGGNGLKVLPKQEQDQQVAA